MTIIATICDTLFHPLTDPIEINNQDDLIAIHNSAIAFADSGMKCCVRWKGSDGRNVYLSPSGNKHRPHWFTPDKPPVNAKLHRRNVSIDDATLEAARKLGGGCISKGIRRALKIYVRQCLTM